MVSQKIYRGLPKSIYIIVFSNMINALGTFVRPMLVLLLTDKLNFSKDYAGLIITIISILYVPGSLIGGKLVDKFGRKSIIVACNVLSAIFIILCIKFFTPIPFIILILLSTFWQSMVRPALNAIMADLTNTENRKKAFSLSYLGLNVGFSLGPAAAGFLYKNHLFLLFLVDGFTTLVCVALIVAFIPNIKPHNQNNLQLSINEQPVKDNAFMALLKRPILVFFALFQMLLGLVYSQFTFALPLQLTESFNKNGPQIYGMLASVNGITVLVCTGILSLLTSKIRSIHNMSLAGIFYALGFGMLFFTKGLVLLIVSTIIWTLGEILAVVNANVFIANNTPSSHRGRFNAILQSISGIGAYAGPWITGLLLRTLGLNSIWLISFAIALSAACLMYMLSFMEHNKIDSTMVKTNS